MRLGCMVRADGGGLASQSYEFWRHLRPDRVFVVDMGDRHRGFPARPHLFNTSWCEHYVGTYGRFGAELEAFLDGLDVVISAETHYDDRVYVIARSYGVATVLHANPELFHDSQRASTRLWAPTEWELHRLPRHTPVIPMPVALDQFTYRPRTRLDTLFFTPGEAMYKRNGEDLMWQTLPLIDKPCRLLYRWGNAEPPAPRQIGKVKVEYLPSVPFYWQVIPEEADVILMPRKYGGLNLPVQEAAAQGVPALMSRLSPQTNWFPSDFLISAFPERDVVMKGGTFTIYNVRPHDLAERINQWMGAPAKVVEASRVAREWAEARSWDALLPLWREELAAAANVENAAMRRSFRDGAGRLMKD